MNPSHQRSREPSGGPARAATTQRPPAHALPSPAGMNPGMQFQGFPLRSRPPSPKSLRHPAAWLLFRPASAQSLPHGAACLLYPPTTQLPRHLAAWLLSTSDQPTLGRYALPPVPRPFMAKTAVAYRGMPGRSLDRHRLAARYNIPWDRLPRTPTPPRSATAHDRTLHPARDGPRLVR